MQTGIREMNERVKTEYGIIEQLFREIGKVIVGQRYLIERLIIGLLADGHILIEGVPGLSSPWSKNGCIRFQMLPAGGSG